MCRPVNTSFQVDKEIYKDKLSQIMKQDSLQSCNKHNYSFEKRHEKTMVLRHEKTQINIGISSVDQSLCCLLVQLSG